MTCTAILRPSRRARKRAEVHAGRRRGRTQPVVKLFYKPVGLLSSIIGGIVAGMVFKRLWQTVAHETKSPKATDRNKGWGAVIAAAAAQGAIFGGVKAVVNRAGAEGFARATGVWPGPE